MAKQFGNTSNPRPEVTGWNSNQQNEKFFAWHQPSVVSNPANVPGTNFHSNFQGQYCSDVFHQGSNCLNPFHAPRNPFSALPHMPRPLWQHVRPPCPPLPPWASTYGMSSHQPFHPPHAAFYKNERQPHQPGVGLKTACENLNNNTSDKMIVERFLIERGKSKDHIQALPASMSTNKKESSNLTLKICEAKDLHQRGRSLLSTLEGASETFFQSDESKNIREELQKILSQLSTPDVIKDLQLKLNKRKKARARRKKCRQTYYKHKVLEKIRMDERNMHIAEWQKQEKVKFQQQLQNEEMKKQMDNTLHELRKEQTTFGKAMEFINAIAKLRTVRVNSAKEKEYSVVDGFDETVKNVNAVLLSHKRLCADKIASLTQIIETNQKQTKLSMEKRQKKMIDVQRKSWEQKRKISLFGKEVKRDPFDPLWPVQQLHHQANASLQNLVECRHQWDQFLHKDGTAIPTGWVEPFEPSSEDWEIYQVKEDSVKEYPLSGELVS
ncbi:unnamed protein product [Clavelina lepadiformis]|uniref:Programmed cell death protein 7 n=1 Tax=Clavelina lepadiformis TaxID=159417 RepID=A0ABP0GCT1_CLALP